MYIHKILLPDGTALTSGRAGADAIRSVTLTEQVGDETDLCPGAACAACAEIELWAPQNGLTIRQGTEIRLYRMDSESGAEEAVGIFLAEKPQKASANVIKVTAYDRMTLLDKDLSPWLRAQQGAFSMSLTALVQAVCGQCGVTLAAGTLDNLPNGSYQVQAFYSDGITGRQLIQWAGQAACRFARMTPAGQLAFSWYEEHAASAIGPAESQSTPTALSLAGPLLCTASGELWMFSQRRLGYFQNGLTFEDYETAPLDKVQIRQSDEDVGVIWPPDAAGTNALVLQGNLLLTTDSTAALQPVARTLFEQLQQSSYTPMEVSIPWTENPPAPGQMVTVSDAYGRQRRAFIMQRKISGQKVTLTATGNARRDGTTAVNTKNLRNLQGKMLEIQTSVDGLNVKASELQGSYTELTQTVDGLELTVVKDGEVRTAFAADTSSVKIQSGLVEFDANTLAIDSTNFTLDSAGNVVATGTLGSNNGVAGNGRNEAVMSAGGLSLYRTNAAGRSNIVASLYGVGTNASLGNILLYGPDASQNQIQQFLVTTDFTGSRLSMRNAANTQTVIFNASGGDGQLSGSLDIQGDRGLGVSTTVSCQNLDCWGSKSRVVKTSFGHERMAAFESHAPLFADAGSGCCNEDGQCWILPDPRFAETLSRFGSVRWLVTPTAPGALWVEKQGQGAIVHGSPGQTFDWLCMAVQSGYDGVYAELTEAGPPPDVNPAIAQLDFLDSFTQELESDLYALITLFDVTPTLHTLWEEQSEDHT